MADPNRPRRFDRRLVILPLIALATAAPVLIPTELALRARYPDREYDVCVNEHAASPHGKPNCVSKSKTAEGPWVENRYNECGYRSPRSCGPKPAGTMRIAIIGSSTANGWLVPEAETLSGRLPAAITRACDRPVETQNLAVGGMSLRQLVDRSREAIRLDPDVLVLVVTSYDLENTSDKPATGKRQIRKIVDQFNGELGELTMYQMARMAYLSREDDYVAHIASIQKSRSRLNADAAAGLVVLAGQLRQVAALGRDRHVPILMMFAPNRGEVIDARLAHGRKPPADIALATIAREAGIPYDDTLDEIPANVPTALFFYTVNYHPNSLGHLYLTRSLEQSLIQNLPVFRGCKYSL